jgi:hypothetical protein
MKKPRTGRGYSLERVIGLEPIRSAWKAGMLPLHHTRERLSLALAGPRVACFGDSGKLQDKFGPELISIKLRWSISERSNRLAEC